MAKQIPNTIHINPVPLMLKIGDVSAIFGISRKFIRNSMKEGKLKPRRFRPRGHWRFVTAEVAAFLGLYQSVPKVAVPLNGQLGRDLDKVITDAVQQGQASYHHELRAELNKLRNDLQGMVKEATKDRPAPQPAINKPLKGYQSSGIGGSY